VADLARSLAKAGYRVETSPDGRQEGDETFDLVICLVRAMDSLGDVVGLSSGATDVLGLIDGADPATDAVSSYGCGAASWIPFPVDEAALLSSVRASVSQVSAVKSPTFWPPSDGH
jgi:DNA-binding response OmpR family regulator